MKNLLAIVVLTMISLTAVGKENVTIYYSWSPADAAANFHRTLADEANKIQDKYHFVFDFKPGAAGSIAANYILNSGRGSAILANSSAFFIRPNLFPISESHDITQFKSILPACNAPIAITSKKYAIWKDVPTNRPVSIGMSGLGSTTHMAAVQIAKLYPNMIIVPFKSTTEALLAVLSDSTDLSVNFLGDSAQYTVGNNKVNVLGITGNQSVNGISLLSGQGFSRDLEVITVPAQLMVPVSLPDSKFNEWRGILLRAGRAKSVLDSYLVDYCQNINQMLDKDIQPWYQQQANDWKRLTQGIKLQ